MRLIPLLLALSAWADAPLEPHEAVHRALSVRHAPPSCEEVEALSPTPVATLLRMVDEVQAPPWVPMRAAECLTRRHHQAIGPQLQRWVTAPELKGLGLMVAGLLDTLPEPTALDLAARAVAEGPDPAAVRRRLQRSDRPALRALATPPAEVTP